MGFSGHLRQTTVEMRQNNPVKQDSRELYVSLGRAGQKVNCQILSHHSKSISDNSMFLTRQTKMLQVLFGEDQL